MKGGFRKGVTRLVEFLVETVHDGLVNGLWTVPS